MTPRQRAEQAISKIALVAASIDEEVEIVSLAIQEAVEESRRAPPASLHDSGRCGSCGATVALMLGDHHDASGDAPCLGSGCLPAALSGEAAPDARLREALAAVLDGYDGTGQKFIPAEVIRSARAALAPRPVPSHPAHEVEPCPHGCKGPCGACFAASVRASHEAKSPEAGPSRAVRDSVREGGVFHCLYDGRPRCATKAGRLQCGLVNGHGGRCRFIDGPSEGPVGSARCPEAKGDGTKETKPCP